MVQKCTAYILQPKGKAKVKKTRKIWWVLIAALALALLLAACGDDDDDEAGDDSANDADAAAVLDISDAWVRATLPMDEGDASDMDETEDAAEMDMTGPATGAFMTISNSGDAPARLVSASVDESIAGTVEVHQTTMDENDVMQMRPVEGIDIPAGESVELAPGGYHIMLLDVQNTLTPGLVIDITLNFEDADPITVSAEVRELASTGQMDTMGEMDEMSDEE